MNVYEYYIKFTLNAPSAGPSIAYLNKIVYVAKTAETEEKWAVVNDKSEIDALAWLPDEEKAIIRKGLDAGASSLYIRGAYTDTWGTDDILPLETYLLDSKQTAVDNIAFTLIMSPYWDAQTKPDGLTGVLVNSVLADPSDKPSEGVSTVLDELQEGSALTIFSTFLAQANFRNMQFKVFKELSGIAPSGRVDTLKNLGITFVFNDGVNNLLGMFTIGGKAAADMYIEELFKYNVRETLRVWIQTYQPTYINDNILTIEERVEKVGKQFVNLGYFESFQPVIAPLREQQLASDIEQFLVNNVQISYKLASAIWSINNIITEEI